MVEGVNKRTTGVMRHPFFVILAEFEKVEIVASAFDFLGPFERSFGDGQKGQARGMASLLRTGENHADSPLVLGDGRTEKN